MRRILRKAVKEICYCIGSGMASAMGTFEWRNDPRIQKKLSDPLYLEGYGFKVYSQNDEDGIIEEIFNRIGGEDKTFVEFGVQNGLECNCHYLLHKGWKGVWIEGNKKYCTEIRECFSRPIADGRLVVRNAFIDRDNINRLIGGGLRRLGIEDANSRGKQIDLLSIDIDGNDYWVWKAITCVSPRVVIIEYNAKFPPNFEWVMDYDPKHMWQGDDEHGASLKALEKLGDELGYQLVATNLTAINAFFVKKELAGDKFALPATAEELGNTPGFCYRSWNGHPAKKYIGK